MTQTRSDLSGAAYRVLASLAAVIVLITAGGAGDDDRDRLKSLSPEQINAIKRNQERFNKMPPAEQQRVRDLHERLNKHEQSSQLTSLLSNYASWLRNLPAGQRAELLSLPSKERLEKIREIINDQEQERFRRLAADNLTKNDHQALVEWTRTLAEKRKEILIEKFPESTKSHFEKASESQQTIMLTYSLLRSSDDLNVDEKEYDSLLSNLSDSAKTTLEEAKGHEKKVSVVREWIRVAAFSRMRSFGRREPVPEEKLTEFYGELSDRLREYLNSLPSDRMKRELERLYHSRWFGRRGPGGRGDGSRTPGPGPGGPGRGGGRGSFGTGRGGDNEHR